MKNSSLPIILGLIVTFLCFVLAHAQFTGSKPLPPDKLTVARDKPFYDHVAMPLDVPGETTWYSPIQHEPTHGPWIIMRSNLNYFVPYRDAGLLYGSHDGSIGLWRKMPVGTRVTQRNSIAPYREYEWIVVQEEHGSTAWQTVESYEYEKERDREPDLAKLDQAKLLPIIQRIMSEAIAYAESESNAVNPRMAIHQQAGFNDAKAFAKLKDPRYYICEQILKEASKP